MGGGGARDGLQQKEGLMEEWGLSGDGNGLGSPLNACYVQMLTPSSSPAKSTFSSSSLAETLHDNFFPFDC